MRFRVLLVALACLVLIAPLAVAQTTGSVSGVVRGEEGAPLPGATVTISGPRMPLRRTTTTLSDGTFQFLGLNPGKYRLRAVISGMGAFEQDVVVSLAKDTEVRPTLRATATEAVEVTAATPLVDTKATDISAVTTKETLQKLPIARTFRGTFQLAPGVAENASTAPNAGGGRQDNTFLYDGVNITNPFFGDLFQDFTGVDIEEVNITRGGISAEFGRTGGFLVNAVTRSGTNELHGSALFEYQPISLAADSKDPTLDRKFERIRPGVSLGGPILRDHVFFYGSANFFRLTEKERVNRIGKQPDAESDTDEYFLKLTVNPVSSHLIDASFRYRDIDSTNSGIGSDSAASVGQSGETKDRVGVLSWLWTASPRLTLEAKYNHNEDRNGIEPVTPLGYQPPFNAAAPYLVGRFQTGTASGQTFIFPPATRVDQFIGGSDLAKNDQDFYRDEYRLQASFLANFLGGSHDIRLGATHSDNQEDLTRVANGWGQIIPINNVNCGAVRPCFRARYVPEQPAQISEGTTWGIFLQDQATWDRLTVNLGVLLNRDEFVPNEGGKFTILRGDFTIPNASIMPCATAPAGAPACTYRDTVTFDFDDQIQPRIGVAYMLSPKVRDKIYVNYGRYSNMDNQSFSRAAAPIRLFRRDAFFNATTGALITEIVRGNQTGKLVLEKVDPTKTDEIIGGYARPLGAGWVAEVWGMYRKIDDIIEDFPGVNRQTASGFRYGNIPGYRKYRAVTLEVRRAYSEKWTLDVSYTLSRLEGNWDLDIGTAVFYTSSYIDDGPGLYVTDSTRDGILIGDRTHVGKIFATYELPTNTNIGAYLRYQSGRPWEARIYDRVNGVPLEYAEKAGSRRMSSWTNLDLLVAQKIPIKPIDLTIEGRVVNVFNSQPELSVDQVLFVDTSNTVANPEFGRPTSYVAPRRFSISAIVNF